MPLMEHAEEMLTGIEESMKKYFPARWTSSDSAVFINTPQFQIDLGTLNNGLNAPIRDFVFRGGKRLRPLLFLTCLEIFGINYRKYFDFAALVELIHNGTLVLDDIEDKGVLRRGLPTLHLKFGLDIATNVGASLHFLPLKILGKNLDGLSERQQLRVWEEVNQELVNVSFGQGLDIYWHSHKSPVEISVNKYLEMVSLKTGSLMRMSVVLACVISNQGEKMTDYFREFAQNLGIAFQIIDDCLDLDPPDEKFGKSYGNDITEGKLSLPVIYCLKQVDEKKREELIYILKKHTRSRELTKKAISIIKESKAIAKSRSFAISFIEESFLNLEKKAGKTYDLSKLQEIGYLLVKRSY